MAENKINITSTLLESTIEGAKGFLRKLLGASVEEYGLMIADNVKLRRFKNQLKMVNKAQKIVEESGINIKQINIKQLVPLLEYSSLEDDESIQDKWSNMLVNFIDINQNCESTIFPYLLSQMSSSEIKIIFEMYNDFQENSFSSKIVIGIERDNLLRLGLVDSTLQTSLKQSFFSNNAKLTDRLIINNLGLEFVKICSAIKK